MKLSFISSTSSSGGIVLSSRVPVPNASAIANSSTVRGLRATATQRSTNLAISSQSGSMRRSILSYTLFKSAGSSFSFCVTCEDMVVFLRSCKISETYKNVPPAFSVKADLIFSFSAGLYPFIFDNSSTLTLMNLCRS